MKLIKFVFIALISISIMSCKESSEKKSVSSEVELPAKISSIKIDIKGMTCEIGCAKTIESKISKIDGVTESKVNFEDKKGEFIFDANKTSEQEIISTINNLIDGKTYSATKHLDHCKPGCDKVCCTVKEGVKECKTGGEKKACCVEKEEAKVCKKDCEKACCASKESHAHGVENDHKH